MSAPSLVKRQTKLTRHITVSSSTTRKSNKNTSTTADDETLKEVASDSKLLPNELTLATLELDTMEKSWYNALTKEFSKTYFLNLKKFLLQEHNNYTIYPALKDVYSWSRLAPLDSVKVVILGQDPYHDVGQAHGLSFSVIPPTKIPPSLRNIYKQLATDVPGFVIPKHGDLSALASAGVLWLNACLTVRAHKANSHSKQGWETFTAEVLKVVTSRPEGKGVVFMAWGLPAQKTCDKIGIDEKKHLVLRSAHPSPLSAHRGFLGNGHFKQANEWLANKYGKDAEIDWCVLNKMKSSV